MSEHHASRSWSPGAAPLSHDSYSREHARSFPEGVEPAASAAGESPGDHSDRVDPEEAFAASLASFHMLPFLTIATQGRLPEEACGDASAGSIEENADGKLAITRGELHPRIRFGDGRAPFRHELERPRDLGHRECFVADPVRPEGSVEPDRPERR